MDIIPWKPKPKQNQIVLNQDTLDSISYLLSALQSFRMNRIILAIVQLGIFWLSLTDQLDDLMKRKKLSVLQHIKKWATGFYLLRDVGRMSRKQKRKYFVSRIVSLVMLPMIFKNKNKKSSRKLLKLQ